MEKHIEQCEEKKKQKRLGERSSGPQPWLERLDKEGPSSQFGSGMPHDPFSCCNRCSIGRPKTTTQRRGRDPYLSLL